jgi:adenylate kinase
MRIVITGSPGVGKTSAARALGKRLKARVVNEKQFALEKKIGRWDSKEDELVIPIEPFARAVNKLLEREKSVILEGHLLCEVKLNADFVVLMRCHPEILESRLESRGYSAEKVQDNVFCEGIDYCKKRLAGNCPKGKLVEIESGKSIKETLERIIKGLKEKGAKL